MPECDFNKVTNFIEITLWDGCSPANLLHVFRAPFPRDTSECLLQVSNLFEALILSGIRFQILASKFAIDSLQIQADLLQSNLTEITLRHGCSTANLLHIFRTPFPRNTSECLLLVSKVFEALVFSGIRF